MMGHSGDNKGCNKYEPSARREKEADALFYASVKVKLEHSIVPKLLLGIFLECMKLSLHLLEMFPFMELLG